MSIFSPYIIIVIAKINKCPPKNIFPLFCIKICIYNNYKYKRLNLTI
jgi:hypothetical protein